MSYETGHFSIRIWRTSRLNFTAVMVTIAIMEREQKLVIFGSEVLVEYRLNEWLLPAFLYMLRQRGNDGSWLSCSL